MRAVNYVLDDKEAFQLFLKNGDIEIHNIAIERCFRHIAMGRRNWGKAGSHEAAENLAFMCSLYESCKMNNLNFGRYIEDILTAGVGGDDMFSNAPGSGREGDRDELYDEAVAAVIKSQKPTISSLQRFLRIGYNRAATLIDQMEADGIISAPDHANKRTILARNNEQLDG